jgi:hypothetical protein
MRAMCFERLIDPKTKRCVAALGWIEGYWPNECYWVSVKSDPYQFFPTLDLARRFYRMAISQLKSARRDNHRIEQRRALCAVA